MNDCDLELKGVYIIVLDRETLWNGLNDPEILQSCIKGCKKVECIEENRFVAEFKFKVGPIKKSFFAHLRVIDINLPDSFRLETCMDAGIAGDVYGTADVVLLELAEKQTRLNYYAEIDAKGWLGELGFKVLGSTAERYLKNFFDKIVLEIEQRERA